jgi:predicted AAA+ superfamily ATPase
MFIERFIKRDVLFSLKNYPVTCIIGPRQSGKTTFVKNVLKFIKKKITYLDLELLTDRRKLENPEIFLKHRTDECVIIDEIQRVPDLFPLIRALVDQKRVPARFLITGSANPSIIRFSSESLAGRVMYIELPPFNLTEIQKKAGMIKHWIRGGFPPSTLAKSGVISSKWLDSFISTYTERDIRILGLNVEPVFMRRLWEMISHFHGGILDMTSIANALDISVPTLKKYFDFLEGAFIIHRLYPYYTNIKKRLLKSPKLYLRDSGILHSLMNINNYDQLQSYVHIGKSWEGYVIEQIKQMTDRISNIKINYYRTHDGSEIDLVLVKGMKPAACIEIRYSSAPSLTRGNLIAINDLKTLNNFIIIPESIEDFQIREDVVVSDLETFLTKYLPKI